MQKVEGSSPFSRFLEKPRKSSRFQGTRRGQISSGAGPATVSGNRGVAWVPGVFRPAQGALFRPGPLAAGPGRKPIPLRRLRFDPLGWWRRRPVRVRELLEPLGFVGARRSLMTTCVR